MGPENKLEIPGLTGETVDRPAVKDLQVQTFGSFQARAGEEQRKLAWRTRKGRELFAYLLDIDGKEVERRQLLETLWQDEIPDNAVPMFHNMIYHIRKELSAYHLDSLVIYENRRYRLDMQRVHCDLTAIRKLAGLVERKDIHGLGQQRQAFLTYWGSYLEDIDNFWAENRRRYFEEIYIRGCFLLASSLGEKEDESSVRLYRNILMADPYSEAAMERLLLIYGRQKQWELIRRSYREFAGTLKKDLGIEPGREVVAAYRRYLKV